MELFKANVMRSLTLLFVLLLFFACSKETPQSETIYPIETGIILSKSGIDSLHFSGQYGNSSSSADVEGILLLNLGETYITYVEDEEDEVFGNFQKEQQDGELTVKIIVNGEAKKEASTSASYGSVYVSWRP